MKPLDLDFADCRARRRHHLALGALALTAALAAALLWQQQMLANAIAQRQMAAGTSAVQTAPANDASAELQRKQAQAALKALNLPWGTLLGTLERVQASMPQVRLLELQPNPHKGEVRLSGQAPDPATLMAYLEALRAQPEFAEAALLSQRRGESAEGEPQLSFVAQVPWKI